MPLTVWNHFAVSRVALGYPNTKPKRLQMKRETATRAQIALLIYLMTNSVLFGAGVIFALTWPALGVDAGFWISVVVAMSFILAAPIAWWIAPRMRARYWVAERAGGPTEEVQTFRR
jgi:hypothetical protein